MGNTFYCCMLLDKFAFSTSGDWISGNLRWKESGGARGGKGGGGALHGDHWEKIGVWGNHWERDPWQERGKGDACCEPSSEWLQVALAIL